MKRDTCAADNEFNDEHMGARISAIFVILVLATFGALFPVLGSKYSFIKMPTWAYFIAKFFGAGVIVATAFIHLLEPAADSLGNECLGGTLSEYPWAFGIALMSLFTLFFFELLAFNFVDRKVQAEYGQETSDYADAKKDEDDDEDDHSIDKKANDTQQVTSGYPDHFQHADDHQDPEALNTPVSKKDKEQYYGQLVSTIVLEFGVVFHSVFIGLALAVSGEEFKTLYIVLVFHQTFEGLGLGSRISATQWPSNKKWLPYVLAVCYGLTTPIAIAIGLGVRHSYVPGSRKALITNGVFDSISAGILMYSGIVELMAHEFLYSGQFKGSKGLQKMISAYIVMCFGAGLMALLGKWA